MPPSLHSHLFPSTLAFHSGQGGDPTLPGPDDDDCNNAENDALLQQLAENMADGVTRISSMNFLANLYSKAIEYPETFY